MRLMGQCVLVTGGGSGLGRGIIDRFIAEGAKIAVLDRSPEKLAQIAEAHGDNVVCVAGDVRSLASNKEVVEKCLTNFGKIDCIIPNAAIWDYSTSLADLPEEQIDAAFDEMFHVNVKGYILAVKAALPSLVASKGSVILTISTSGFYSGGGGPLYVASKHAVVGLVRELAYELAPYIRVNAIAPGGVGGSDIRGPAALNLQNTSINSIPLDEILAAVLPMGQMASAAEYAGSYVFLASREDNVPASGAIIMLDSGLGLRGLMSAAGGKDLGVKYGLEKAQ